MNIYINDIQKDLRDLNDQIASLLTNFKNSHSLEGATTEIFVSEIDVFDSKSINLKAYLISRVDVQFTINNIIRG